MVKQLTKESKRSRPQERQRIPQEFEQKLLDVSRVARVTAGGRRFSFRVVVVIGDKKGRVGVGVKKGKDVQFAVEKAVRSAKKNLLQAPMTKRGTIPYESYGKSGSSIVFLKPGAEGRGIIAGGAARAVCDLAGYESITGKILSRSNNKLNIARATIEALKKIKTPKEPEQPVAKVAKKITKKKKDVSNSRITKKQDTESTRTEETKTQETTTQKIPIPNDHSPIV